MGLPAGFTPNQAPNNGIVTSEEFVLSYQMDPVFGILTLTIWDGQFNSQLFKEYRIGRDFGDIKQQVSGGRVYLLLSNQNSYKILTVIDVATLEIQFFPISVSLGQVDRFEVFENTLLLVQSLDKGDFVQMYNYRTGTLISLSELYYPKTRVWDIQAKDGIFDILVYKKGDFINQSLKMIGYTVAGAKVYETDIQPPGNKKLIFKSAKLVSASASTYSIVGTFARKQGEQFSGYYHVTIDDFLQQEAKIHTMRSLEGFFDYKKNPGLRKNTRNLRREMVVFQTKSNADYIVLAASSDKVVRKFVHFILLDNTGQRIYDTSVKVFYPLGWALEDETTLGLIDRDVYFVFEGSKKVNVLPGFKLFQIRDGSLTGLVKINEFMESRRDSADWEELRVYHWKENKFIVLGVETVDGTPRYVVEKIEV
jgi:hypothetical protein